MYGNQTLGGKSRRKILKEALTDKNSKVYLSKNVAEIQEYLRELGTNIKRQDIKSFLLTQRSAAQITKNASRRKKSEVSRSFDVKHEFFYSLYSDICYLSKNRKYNAKEKLDF